MTLPYFLGCPQWQHPVWNSQLPTGPTPLARYAQVFNCVEGNTTFYATPTSAQCAQWRSQVSDDFRFLLKFPKSITHEHLLAAPQKEVHAFLKVIAPLHDVLGPFLLQLPATFGPQHLGNLWRFVDTLAKTLPTPWTCTVEVRHRAFFEKGETERALNRGLRERNMARVCLDSRGLFSATPDNESIRDAHRKKPKVPVHLLPVEAPQVIRYIGHPDLESNRPFLEAWVDRVANWTTAGQPPYVFMHMPDNGEALSLAAMWNELLRTRLDTLLPLPLSDGKPQMGLF